MLDNAIAKYGADDFIVETILECPVEELDAKEIDLIEFHKTYVDDGGYNLTRGGAGFTGSMPDEFNRRQSENMRIHCLDENLGMHVAYWPGTKTDGYVVKVPEYDWKYFCDPNMTKDERREAAKSYRDELANGGREKDRRTKKDTLGYELPDYVYYKQTQDGFNIDIPGKSRKNFVKKGDMKYNLKRAMQYYMNNVEYEVDPKNWERAYFICEELDSE